MTRAATRRWHGAAVVVFALSLFCTHRARADGMIVTSTGSDVSVQATAQRAVLWYRDGVWEVFIEPKFSRDQTAAAWIVPFSVLPEVSEAAPEFVDQLNLLTSPVFFEVCYVSGCGVDTAGGGGMEGIGSSVDVRIWEKGTIGALDYVVLSSQEGEALTDWLAGNGYEIQDTVAEALAGMETEDVFFFVAKVSSEVDPSLPLPTVRFRLPGLAEGVYPLRLTRAGLPVGATLDLSLWVVFPADAPRMPASHLLAHPREYLASPDDPTSPDELQKAIEAWFDSSGHQGFALVYGGDLLGNVLLDGCTYDIHGVDSDGWDSPPVCLDTDLRSGLPKPWCPEVREIRSGGLTITRYEARLDRDALLEDLTLEGGIGWEWGLAWSNAYALDAGDHQLPKCEKQCPPVDFGDARPATDIKPSADGVAPDADTSSGPSGPKRTGGCASVGNASWSGLSMLLVLLFSLWGLRKRPHAIRRGQEPVLTCGPLMQGPFVLGQYQERLLRARRPHIEVPRGTEDEHL